MELDLQPLELQTPSFHPIVIAGPCSAETEEQVLQTALALAKQGYRLFRAGIWKPRTKPGGFEGNGEMALPWMKNVKNETGMLVSTEVATPQHVELALKHELDFLWIGARTTTNPFAMQALAASSTAMRIASASGKTMAAVAASEIAMTAVAANEIAMKAVAANEIAMKAVAASKVAMKTVAASEIAMKAVVDSEIAMKTVAASEVAMKAVAGSGTALKLVIAEDGNRKLIMAHNDTLQAVRAIMYDTVKAHWTQVRNIRLRDGISGVRYENGNSALATPAGALVFVCLGSYSAGHIAGRHQFEHPDGSLAASGDHRDSPQSMIAVDGVSFAGAKVKQTVAFGGSYAEVWTPKE